MLLAKAHGDSSLGEETTVVERETRRVRRCGVANEQVPLRSPNAEGESEKHGMSVDLD